MNKYHAKSVTINGIHFASMKEGRRYNDLRILERAGKIENLEVHPAFRIVIDGRQVTFPNGRKAVYTADFSYFDLEKKCRVIEDVKSPASRTEAYVLRKCIVEHIYGITITEI